MCAWARKADPIVEGKNPGRTDWQVWAALIARGTQRRCSGPWWDENARRGAVGSPTINTTISHNIAPALDCSLSGTNELEQMS